MDEYFKSAIAYYFKYLIDNGYNDPVAVIISDFIDTIKITDEQREYILNKNKVTNNDTINNMIILIDKMKADGKIDVDSLNLIRKGLKHLM